MSAAIPASVEAYVLLGLRLGRHIDGFVDAYFGPPEWSARVAAEPVSDPGHLLADARRLVADLDAGDPDLDPGRRSWLRGQAVGLATSAAKLAGHDITYSDEVEACYGVRPVWVDESEFDAAHQRLDASLAGTGSLPERLAAFRNAHVVPTDQLRAVVDDILDNFRERTHQLFPLPDGEHIDVELVSNQPWSGFNYYLGDLHSRVAINTDLPMYSTSIGHLIAHEAYPGHHTEHTRKEVGLVRARGVVEETIFLVGTPQCTVAEGLADLAIEVLLGESQHQVMAELLAPHGLRFDTEAVEAVSAFGELAARGRGNVGLLLHERGASPDEAADWAQRWLLLDRARAAKAVEFQVSDTWRAYISCYVEGLPLCRAFVAGDASRFERLLTESLLPSDLLSRLRR